MQAGVGVSGAERFACGAVELGEEGGEGDGNICRYKIILSWAKFAIRPALFITSW
jgi:hypothetical protein